MIEQELDDLSYGIEKSIRYHQRRRGWLETWHRVLMFLIILSGSSALLDIAQNHVHALALFGALLGAFDLVTGISVKARDYAILQGKFSALLAEITRAQNVTEDQIRDWRARRIEIEAEEPPIFWVLEADCDNEVARLRGKDKSAVRIRHWYWLTMHILRHETFYAPRPAQPGAH